MKLALDNLINKLKIPDSETVQTDNWKSPDVICLPPSRRTWGHIDFLGFWNVIALSISTWQSCSTLLGFGLNVWQCMLCVIVAKILMFFIALSHGWGGAVWHVGYPVYSRFTFGLWGSYLALVQRIVLCTVWYSTQSYTAGQLIAVILSAIFPSFNTLKNTLPDSLPMTTKQFIGFMLYHVISIPFFWIKPENFNKPFKIITVIAFFTVFGTSIGCLVHADGAGDLLTSKSTIKGSANMGMAFMHAINAVINTYAVGLANQPDFSRFASKPGKQIWGQFVSIVLFGTVVPLFGILGTSAASKSYGSISELNLWNPPNIIQQWLEEKYTAKSRCAAFFSAFGFFISTLGLNVIDNGVSGGIDLVAVAPKFIDVRRGIFLIAMVSILIQPWQILSSGTVFVSVLGSYGCFFGPMIGVFTADYYIVRKQKLKLSDLFRGESDSIYWFWKGINWRGYVSWICGFVPGITGFPSVDSSNKNVPEACIKMFYISFIIGYGIGFVVHVGINHFFPPPGIGEYDEYDIYQTFTKSEAEKLGVVPHEKQLALEGYSSGQDYVDSSSRDSGTEKNSKLTPLKEIFRFKNQKNQEEEKE